MMWQDLVFTAGSTLSIVFLAPTLRNAGARVPLGTSVPSMAVGSAYAFTFFTLGMTFSAVGAMATATMWSLIAAYRSPNGNLFEIVGRDLDTVDRYLDAIALYGRDVWIGMKRYEVGYRYVR